MSFSVRFNAEDEEVEGLCTTPTSMQSTGTFVYMQMILFKRKKLTIVS